MLENGTSFQYTQTGILNLKHTRFYLAVRSYLCLIFFGIWALTLWTGFIAPSPAAALDAGSQAGHPVSLSGAEGFEPRLGTYTYVARWEGSKAFEATVTVQKQDNLYRILVDSRTTGIIDFIFKIRYRGEGFIRSEDFTPMISVMSEEQRSRSKETQLYYLEGGGIEVIQTRTKKKQEPRTISRTISPEAAALEPFSAAFLVRKFDWRLGEVQQFEVLTGKDTYLVTLVCQEKTIVEESGTQTEAWVIRPAVSNLSKPHKKSKISKTKLYLSADPHKELLKMKSQTKAGMVVLKMKDFVPQ